MRNKVAKMLRHSVYGDYSTRNTKYKPVDTGKRTNVFNKITGLMQRLVVTKIIADPRRQTYQGFKRRWNEFNWKERSSAKRATKALSASTGDVREGAAQ